ncbi:MAG TPA: hypothetical protein VG869_02320 [Acidimicrobiia bacterium]|nr:hypothetical protein [Acidimicrobiia bacterium]
MSKKRTSRQTRRYSTATPPRRPTPSKRPAWRRFGRRRRRSLAWPWALALAVVVASGSALIVASSGSSSTSTAAGASAGPLLASTASFDGGSPGQPVDGIQCNNAEQLLFHVHSHLAVFVDGQQRSVPAGIGIAPPRQSVAGATGSEVVAGSCFYWLHSHTADGVIHIESPLRRTYTLGEYFDIWHQPLSATQVGPAQGPVIAYVNGVRFSGNPRDITIGNHTRVQLDVGRDVSPRPYTFPLGL